MNNNIISHKLTLLLIKYIPVIQMTGIFINRLLDYFTNLEIVDILDFIFGSTILATHNVYASNKIMYDYVFVATMCKADYLGSSIKDENHLALYVKDTIDDVDASNETTFRRWLATMIGNGIPIDWDEII